MSARLKGRRRQAAAVIEFVTRWAARQSDVQALALVGSYAYGRPRMASDVDLMLLTINANLRTVIVRAQRYGRRVVNVCLAGVTGWAAPPIVAAVDAAADLSLTCGVSRSAAGQPLSAVGSTSDGFIYPSVSEALASADVDVLVDYTSATAVQDHAWSAVLAGVHVVIGSSGLTTRDYEELDQLARDNGVGVIAAGNFSIMAAVLRRAAAIAAQHLSHWEIVDYASAGKPDVPSGTSRDLAETLARVRVPEPAAPLAELHGPVEARGTDVAGTRIHSVRLPSFVVTTEIVFAGPGERLVMRHDPGESPEPYVQGTLLAIRRVHEAPGVRSGLDSLLFDEPLVGP